jgi:hypothetical protein
LPTTPSIDDARAIGKRYGLKGVVIIHHDGDQAGYVSWGHTKTECTRMRGMADRFFELLLRLWGDS